VHSRAMFANPALATMFVVWLSEAYMEWHVPYDVQTPCGALMMTSYTVDLRVWEVTEHRQWSICPFS